MNEQEIIEIDPATPGSLGEKGRVRRTVHASADQRVADAPASPCAVPRGHGPFCGRCDRATVVCHGRAAIGPRVRANRAETVRSDRVNCAVANDGLVCGSRG